MDAHTQSISIAVGTVTMECVIETKANTFLQFMDGQRGDSRAAFEVARHTARWAALFLFLAKQAETIFVGGALMFRTGVGQHLAHYRPVGQPASLPTGSALFWIGGKKEGEPNGRGFGAQKVSRCLSMC